MVKRLCVLLGLLALGLMVGSCDTPPDPEPTIETPEPEPEPQPEPEPDLGPCDLDRLTCLRSRDCVLELLSPEAAEGSPGQSYHCRPAVGPCEEGMAQQDSVACEALEGCTYDGGGCFCPCPGYGETQVLEDPEEGPGCACVCAGGAPPTCRASDEKP